MAKNSNKTIWDAAIPLQEAWEQFASPDALAAYRNLPTGIENLPEPAEPVSIINAALTVGSLVLAANQKRKEAADSLKDELLDRLFNADLLAFGYRIMPSKSPMPVQISPDFFDHAAVNWENGEAEFNGKRYGYIRVIAPQSPILSRQPRVGRPGSSSVIDDAIKQAVQTIPDFRNLPRKTACDEIRKIIGAPEIKGNGLSNTNLEKHIVRNCGPRRIAK